MITRTPHFIALSTVLIVAFCGATPPCRSAQARVDYLEQIKPILRERCFVCHGALKQEAGLRVDTVELMSRGGDSGAVIAPGDASKSILLERLVATDVTERMPREGEPLSVEQIALLRTWIEQGAPAPANEEPEVDPREHWAFRPIVRPSVPVVGNQEWTRNPIDAFLARQHRQYGLTPQPEVSRIVLLRRLYFDLVGVPPSPEEITAFENDPAPEWYERTVTRLLDDPRHGERWARHWMDIWRYSDWWGFGEQPRNSQKHIWRWRDWIVESLNADTPYDDMVRLMLAADELHPDDLDKLQATGYLVRNYFLFNRNQWMEETVEHVSKGFLGLTMNCAKCHDHKYDPIQQADFYRMRAFFEPYHVRIDIVPGEADVTLAGIPRVFDRLLEAPTYLFVRGQEKNPDKSRLIAPGVPEVFEFEALRVEPVSLPVQAREPERRPWVFDAHLERAKKNIDAAEEAVAEAREKLASAQKSDADVRVAEAALTVANAGRVCVERRADAMRAAWAVVDNKSDDSNLALTNIEREKAAAAIRADHQELVARAQHGVAVAELALLRAADDKKDTAEKTLKTARETLEKASVSAEEEIQPTDQYTRLAGAEWVATRFFNSLKDDPAVEFPPRSTGRRTALANWIADPRNPLTARVAVNHIWLRHMGAPLVSTVFDFGRNGASPTHPELLDWLASELIDSGWSMKHLHRTIVNSAAYRMSSSIAGGEPSAARDSDNRSLWRRVPVRLESQVVRDTILALAGTLDLTMGGPPVLAAQQDASTRRSLYFFHSNNDRNLFLTTFDEATVKDCYRREQSIVPQQALALTNSGLVLDASQKIAARLSDGAADDASFIRRAFSVLLGISASDAEIAASNKALESWRRSPDASADQTRAHLVWALINHNDFVTVR